jgi:tRNA A37 methylthiotransferase MiaB
VHKVLLVNPWVYDFSAFDLWSKPLGLLYIASFLEKKGCEVLLLDCLDRYDPLLLEAGITPENRLYGTGKYHAEEIRKPGAINSIPKRFWRFGMPVSCVRNMLRRTKEVDTVLITSVMTYWYQGVFDMIGIIREELPGANIVLGGIYAQLISDHARKRSGADLVISDNNPYAVLQELIIGKDKCLSTEGFYNAYSPAYHLYDKHSSIAMLTSLGCPFYCSYCASHLLAKDFLFFAHEKIIDEIEMYTKRLQVQDIALYDDALLYRAEDHFLPLFEKILEKDYRIRFHTPNGIHARFVTEDVAAMLYRSNFKTIRIGLESSNVAFQNKTGNKVYNEEVEHAVSNLLKAGFSRQEIGIYIMAGRFDQSVDDTKRTLEFIRCLGVKVFISEFSPVPGSFDWSQDAHFKNMDPLWQNNSIAFLRNGWTIEQMQKMKDIKNDINHSLTNS